MTGVFSNIEQYIELTQEYSASVIEGGAAFWSRPPEEIESRHQQLMIVQFEYTENWDTMEMHPLCDEIITLLEGDAEFILNPGAEEERVKVKAGETVIIPRGT